MVRPLLCPSLIFNKRRIEIGDVLVLAMAKPKWAVEPVSTGIDA